MEHFKKLISTLKPFEQDRVLEFLEAIRTPCAQTLRKDSEIVDDAFADEFRSRLLIQHSFVGTPLFQDSFEIAFSTAATAAGHTCRRAPAGERFWDVEVGDKKISLKSTKARNLREDKLTISKLTEAAWIQDCRTAVMREAETKTLFKEYVGTVDSVYQLRFFVRSQKYELVEIPIGLFAPILQVPRRYFDSDGPSIGIPIGETPPVLTLRLDRSDAKITITNILKSHCMVHGTWVINAPREKLLVVD